MTALMFQHDIFEATADAGSGAIAVDDHGTTLRYGELEDRANRLAHALRDTGCGPSRRVCILMKKGADSYAAVLASLKAGGCWVPLSTSFPHERLRFLLESLRPVAVVVDSSTADETNALREAMGAAFALVVVGDRPGPRLRDSVDEAHIRSRPAVRPRVSDLTPEDLAYIIFTSGSTGTPKGVMVRHRNTVQFLSLCSSFFGIEPESRFAHF